VKKDETGRSYGRDKSSIVGSFINEQAR